MQLSGGVLDVTKLKYFTADEFSQRVRYWDLAATEQKEGVDPTGRLVCSWELRTGRTRCRMCSGSALGLLRWRSASGVRQR